MINEEKCWTAVTRREAASDGKFYFGVLTTGVYCRPSCPARQPLRKNVRFYQSPGDAERAGLRPCLRCRPLAGRADEETLHKVRDICAYIQQNAGSESLTLEILAARAAWSPFHLQRTFKSVLGITPKQWLDAQRVSEFKRQLKRGARVTDAVYEAGFGASSRVYEKIDRQLGMTPGQYRAGGKDIAISYITASTKLGCLLAAATDRGLCFVQFGANAHALLEALRAEYPQAQLEKARAGRALDAWMSRLVAYIAGGKTDLHLPFDVQASVFQLKVWRYLQTIPPGETRTYGEVASAIGAPGASRAVGTACGSNKVALVIPCHRVIRGDGGMGGYRWGVERKIALLNTEKKR